jgi:hypothetical protein
MKPKNADGGRAFPPGETDDPARPTNLLAPFMTWLEEK